MYLHVNQYSRVDELIAFSLQPLKETSNYLCLYHMHDTYLNYLVQRWQDGLVSDLYNYFRQPWACAIFHDRFPDFMKEVRELLQTESLKVFECSWIVTTNLVVFEKLYIDPFVLIFTAMDVYSIPLLVHRCYTF